VTVVFRQYCATPVGFLTTAGRSLMVRTLLQLSLAELVGLLPADESDDIDEIDADEPRLSKEEAQLASAEVVELADETVESRCWHL
jgi:hypothetical protein